MGRPHLRIAGRTPPARRQNGAEIGHELSLHEQFGEGRVRYIVGRPRQREFGIGGHFDLARAAAVIGDRYAADFRVVFRRHGNFQRGRDRAVLARDFGAIFGEYDFITVGLG